MREGKGILIMKVESPYKTTTKAAVAGAVGTGAALAGKKIYTTGKDAFVKSMTAQAKFLDGKTTAELEKGIDSFSKKIKYATPDGVLARAYKSATTSKGSVDEIISVILKGTEAGAPATAYQDYKKAIEQTANIIEDKTGAMKQLAWQKEVASVGAPSKSVAFKDAIDALMEKASDKIKGGIDSVSKFSTGFKNAESKSGYIKESIKGIDKKQMLNKAKPILIGAAITSAVVLAAKTIKNNLAKKEEA